MARNVVRVVGDEMIRRSKQVSPSTKTRKSPEPTFGGSSQPAKVGSKVFPPGTSK